MKINLEMANKLNIKATQGQDLKGKLLADDSKRNIDFERNLYPYSYFWTHGFRVTNWHSSQTCSTPAAGHQRTTTQQNIMGGNKAGKENRGMGVDKLKLVNKLYYLVNTYISRSNASAIAGTFSLGHYLKADAPHDLASRRVASIHVEQ